MSDTYIRSNLEKFYESFDMPGGYRFDHVETLKTIDLYYNGKFKTGQYDAQGFKKYFFNIVKPACDIATKFIDLDTKDIILYPDGSGYEFKIWLMQRKLKQWMKLKNFGVLLNEIAFSLPKYGSVVLKKGDVWQLVNLQNLRFDTACKSLSSSSYVYELISMTEGEIEAMGWDAEKVEELLGMDCENYFVYDCWELNGKKWKHTVRAEMFNYKKGGELVRSTEAEINTENDYLPSIVLFEEETKDFPYREVHWERVPGRWLGYGFVEYLEDNQVALNEAENLERKGLAFTSLKIYQTRDQSIGGSNLLTSTQNGDILTIESEITAVPMEERNLAAFNSTRTNWQQNTERKTFTSDITTGANLPSRTPLGVANLQASFATSYFELKRENYGLFLKEIILNDIIPSFKKENRKAHQLTFLSSDEEISKLDKAIVQAETDKVVIAYANKTGFFPSQGNIEAFKAKLEENINRNEHRYIDVPARFYEEAKYWVDVNITGESIDNGVKSQVLQLALQIVGTNPAVLQDEVSRTIFFKLLGLGGISPVELGMMSQATPTMPMQGGQAGSLSTPAPIQGLTSTSRTI